MVGSKSWSEGIAEITKHDDEREHLRNERLDKIVTELEAVDSNWYLHYSEGYRIAVFIFGLDHALTQGHYKSAMNTIQELKRRIVENQIFPAMNACIRAGYITPKEQNDA